MPAPPIEFPADDADRARRFWSGVLGIDLKPRVPHAGSGWDADDRRPASDMATTLERVRELGGSLIHPPASRGPSAGTLRGTPFALTATPKTAH